MKYAICWHYSNVSYIWMYHLNLWRFFFITGSLSFRYIFQWNPSFMNSTQSLSSQALLQRKTRWNVLISYPTDYIYVLSHLHHADACHNCTKIIFASALHYSVPYLKQKVFLLYAFDGLRWTCTKQKSIYRIIKLFLSDYGIKLTFKWLMYKG